MQYTEGGGGAWREDSGSEQVEEFLARALGAAAVGEVDLPHIVICRDEETGSVSYSGPFPNGLTALVFAERESALDQALNDGDPLRFSAAALYPTGPRGFA